MASSVANPTCPNGPDVSINKNLAVISPFPFTPNKIAKAASYGGIS
jgi:hypothetical protein